jgi:hypothetical protein
MPRNTASKVATMIRHHRVSLRDAVLVAGTIVTAGLIAFEYDFGGAVPEDKRIEFHEAIALAVIVISGLIYFGWRRMTEQEARSHDASLQNNDPMSLRIPML